MFVFVFATVPPPQKRVLDQAAGAPTLASAVNIGAFTSATRFRPGSAGWSSPRATGAGYGYAAPNWIRTARRSARWGWAVVSGALERGSARDADDVEREPIASRG
ncbi:hypothetical protein [Nocardia sp. bgisy134]|uniref:hypothetical protein n=1 Tax=Nocardia sp. bgisy134 TaxID=3413789 RepID=UPI003D719F66